MAKIKVTIAHDIHGRIVSISRLGKGVPGKNIKSVVLAKDGQLVLTTDVEEESIGNLIHSHRVDTVQRSLVLC